MRVFIDAGFHFLPEDMDTIQARAMLYSIAFQESGFQTRNQFGEGPARSFWQFEPVGIKGVIEHPSSAYFAKGILGQLYIEIEDAYEAITYSDPLATAFARLNLWRLPDALPEREDVEEGWKQYLEAWKPGIPRPEKWPDNFERGWELALAEERIQNERVD